jgi:hypothetical protein
MEECQTRALIKAHLVLWRLISALSPACFPCAGRFACIGRRRKAECGSQRGRSCPRSPQPGSLFPPAVGQDSPVTVCAWLSVRRPNKVCNLTQIAKRDKATRRKRRNQARQEQPIATLAHRGLVVAPGIISKCTARVSRGTPMRGHIQLAPQSVVSGLITGFFAARRRLEGLVEHRGFEALYLYRPSCRSMHYYNVTFVPHRPSPCHA